MIIEKNFLTINPCFKQQRYITPKGLMLHSVGCPQPSAKVFMNSFNMENASAMVHGFIDAETGVVYQTAPWSLRCWHGGSGNLGSANNTYIGVEMCEPSSDTIKYVGGATITVKNYDKALKYVQTAYNSAVELFAYLCEEYNLDPMYNILSHHEGYIKGIATNHGDPDHLFKLFGFTMDGFREDVQDKMEDNMTQDKFNSLMDTYLANLRGLSPSTWAETGLAEAKARGITDGTAPQGFATREQVAIMINNALKGDDGK